MKKIKIPKWFKYTLLPLVFARYSLFLVFPLTVIIFLIFGYSFHYIFYGVVTYMFIYNIVFVLLMSKFKLMKKWTDFLIKRLKIEYNVDDTWKDSASYFGILNEYPILKIGDKEYEIYLTTTDSNLYDREENIKRKAIHLFIINN